MKSSRNSKSSKSKNNIIIILAVFLLLAIVGVVVGVVLRKKNQKKKKNKIKEPEIPKIPEIDVSNSLKSFNSAKKNISYEFLFNNTKINNYVSIFKSINYDVYNNLVIIFKYNNDSEVYLIKSILYNIFMDNLNDTYEDIFSRHQNFIFYNTYTVKELIERIN